MHGKFLKLKVMAALFSAAFLLGAGDAGAYTYTSKTNIAAGDLKEDENDLVINADFYINGDLTPQKVKTTVYDEDYTLIPAPSAGDIVLCSDGYEENSEEPTTAIIVYADGSKTDNSNPYVKEYTISEWNKLFEFDFLQITPADNGYYKIMGDWTKKPKHTPHQSEILVYIVGEGTFIKAGTKITTNLGDANITISGENITASVSGNVKTSGSISIANNAKFVVGGNITAGGVVKTNNFLVGEVNAANVITNKLTVGGTLIASRDTNFNNGVALNSQKITGLAVGTVDSASMEAITGSQIYEVQQAAKAGGAGALTAGGDVSISSANAISINKAGAVTANNTGIISGGEVYNVTNAMQTSLNGIASSVSKNQASISSIQDGMSELKSSVANINASVASTTKNLSSSLSNRLQADLGNLSDDGKNVIKNLIAETLRGMSGLTIAVNEASFAQSNVSSVSIMPTVEAATVDAGNGASTIVSVGDIDGVYASLNGKVGITDFDSLKTDVGQNITAITVNAGNIKTNVLAIDTLKSSKANVDGSNIDVAKYSEKLGTGKLAAGEAGLVTGSAVYSTLDSKVDRSYVDAGLDVMSNQLESVKQNVTHDMNRMGANATALTFLHPQGYDSEDKLNFAVGYGHYHDTNATAIGAFYHPNAATMVSLAGTVGNGDSMVSAGLSFKLGMNANVEKVMITKKDFDKQQVENQKIKGHLDNQTTRLQQMEATLSAMLHR